MQQGIPWGIKQTQSLKYSIHWGINQIRQSQCVILLGSNQTQPLQYGILRGINQTQKLQFYILWGINPTQQLQISWIAKAFISVNTIVIKNDPWFFIVDIKTVVLRVSMYEDHILYFLNEWSAIVQSW